MESSNKLMLSLVVPVFNTDRDLFEKHLRSLGDIQDGRIEAVFVDDGSELAYGEWLRQRLGRCDFPHILIRQENSGQNAARVRGLAAARGEWIMFIDSDDPLGDGVDELLDYLSTTDDDLVLVGVQRELPNGSVLGVELRNFEPMVDRDEVLVNCPPLWGFVVRRSLLLEPRCGLIVGPRIAEDVASSFKIISASKRIGSCPFLYRYVMNPVGAINAPREEWLLDPIEAFRPLVARGGVPCSNGTSSSTSGCTAA